MMGQGDVSTGTGSKLVRVRIGEPISIPTEGSEEERVQALLEQSRAAIERLFLELRERSDEASSEGARL